MKKGRLKGKHLLYPSLKMKIITTLFQEQILRGIDKYQTVIPIGFTHFSFYKELKLNHILCDHILLLLL